MMLNTGRRESLTRELQVLDAQRRGIVAELKRLAGRRVHKGSVTARAIAYLRSFGSAATTKELVDFIVAERPMMTRRTCMASLYRAAHWNQIVRQGKGWVLPESVVISRGS